MSPDPAQALAALWEDCNYNSACQLQNLSKKLGTEYIFTINVIDMSLPKSETFQAYKFEDDFPLIVLWKENSEVSLEDSTEFIFFEESLKFPLT